MKQNPKDTYIIQHPGSCVRCQHVAPCNDRDYYCTLISDPETDEAIVDPNGWCEHFIGWRIGR